MLTHQLIAKFLSIVVALIGLIVAVGWYANRLYLIQVNPHFAPMQFNTSLCFFIAGSGLLASFYKQKLISFSCGCFIGLISSLTIIQYLLKTDFNLDNFFITSYIHFNQSFPGRMAFITACGLFIIGLILMRKGIQKDQSNLFYNRLLSSIVLAIGVIPLIGYFTGLNKVYSFGQLTPMAPHTAVEFILFSLAIVANKWGQNFKTEERPIAWFSVLSTLFLFLFTLLIWQQNIKIEDASAIARMSEEETAIANNIRLKINSSVKALSRLAKRWEVRQGTPKNEWLADAKNYLADTEELLAIEWIDETNNIQWVATPSNTETKLNVYKAQKVPSKLKGATTISLLTPSDTMNNKVLISYVPIYYQEKIHGFIAGVYNIKSLVENAFPPMSGTLFNIFIREGKIKLYNPASEAKSETNVQSHSFDFFNKQWTIFITPKAQYFKKYPILVPHLELMIGIIFSLLTGIALYNALISGQRNLKLSEKTEALSKMELEQSRLISSINESTDFIGMADMSGKLLYHNRAAREMVGLPLDHDMSSMTIADMHPKWFSKKIENEIVPIVFQKGFWSGDSILIHHQSGREIPVLQTVTLHKDEHQNTTYLTTIMRDITERKKAEAALKVSEELFRSTMEFAAIGMALVTLDGHFTTVNKSLCSILGYSEAELLNKTFQEITCPEDLEKDLSNVAKLLANQIETYQMEKRYIHKDGKIVWILLSASLVRDSDKKPLFFIAQIQDIDNQKKIEQELTYLAFHDSLTHLENRKHLVSAFELAKGYAIRNKNYIAVMFLDLDFFKSINDIYGHDIGDLLLIEIASRLKTCKRSNDILVRLGGDEFIFVATELTQVDMAAILAKRLIAALTNPLTIQKNVFNITFSMGISIYPRDGDNLETLLKNADKALYQVKNEGRNNFKEYNML